MKETAIRIAKRLCDTMIGKFPNAGDLPPKGFFLYHQGVFLSGMMKTYELTQNEKYFNYAKAWADSIIVEDGRVIWHDPGMLDYLQPAVILFPIYERTHEKRYKTVIDKTAVYLRGWPKNYDGGFWHKFDLKNQMWLDGLYMAGPFMAQYAEFNNEPAFLDEAAKQAVIMYEHTLDKKSGLLFHVWDAEHKQKWADPKTGCSPEIWSRGLGWYSMAITDIISFMPKEHHMRPQLEEIINNLFKSIMKYRDEDKKLWYQVTNKKDADGNWLEGSGSSLFTAAIAKAIRLGVLDKKYIPFVNESFEGGYKAINYNGNDVLVDNVCIWTSVGDYKNYIGRSTAENDLHGVGAFLLMCTEVARIN